MVFASFVIEFLKYASIYGTSKDADMFLYAVGPVWFYCLKGVATTFQDMVVPYMSFHECGL